MPLIEAWPREADGTYDSVNLQRIGPTIQVSVCTEVDPTDLINARCENVLALIDSGACQSMIDAQLAQRLGLVEIDKAQAAGVGGVSVHSVYMANLAIPQLDYHQFGKFMSADLKAGKQIHEVLLGRDFLSNTIMIYDGVRAQVTLASAKK